MTSSSDPRRFQSNAWYGCGAGWYGWYRGLVPTSGTVAESCVDESCTDAGAAATCCCSETTMPASVAVTASTSAPAGTRTSGSAAVAEATGAADASSATRSVAREARLALAASEAALAALELALALASCSSRAEILSKAGSAAPASGTGTVTGTGTAGARTPCAPCSAASSAAVAVLEAGEPRDRDVLSCAISAGVILVGGIAFTWSAGCSRFGKLFRFRFPRCDGDCRGSAGDPGPCAGRAGEEWTVAPRLRVGLLPPRRGELNGM